MKKKIAVLPGDGIGPEVVEQAVKVLDAIAQTFDHEFEYSAAPIGAMAIELTGSPLPEETVEICLKSDAVLMGAIGHPKYDSDPDSKVRPEQGLLGLRKSLALYANIRPVKTISTLAHLSPLNENRIRGVDFMIFRELTGGIYFGDRAYDPVSRKAHDTMAYTEEEVRRIAELAFRQARLRRRKVTSVDKANVLATSRLWRRVVREVGEQYPDVLLEHMYVDNAAMQLIHNPRQFDILLTSNMFGDILSDEASVLVGSLGLLPSSSVGLHTSLYEPVHGSYPQVAGKDIANPAGTILSAGLMLEDFGLLKEANIIRFSIQQLLEKGVGTSELDPEILQSCSQFGDLIESLVELGKDINFDQAKFNQKISTII